MGESRKQKAQSELEDLELETEMLAWLRLKEALNDPALARVLLSAGNPDGSSDGLLLPTR